jgi:long-chain fatty acid transport protein
MIDTEVSTLKKHITTAVTTLALLLIAGEAFAGGFYLPGRGVRPMGRAGAFVASGEGNLNSLWYNPANLTLTDGLQFTVDLAVVDLAFDFQRAPRTTQGGDTVTYAGVQNSAAPQPIPQILIGGPTPNKDLSWAFGFYTPYMSPVSFPENGPQRYSLVDNTGSAMGFLHAAVSYNLGDAVRVGAGVQNAFANFRLVSTTSAYTGLHGRPEDQDLDILSKIELSDFFAPAGNLGIWVKLGPKVEAAISAQTPVYFEDTDATLTVRMPSNPEFDNARLTNNTLAASMVLPAIARVALRFVSDPIDVELAGVWEGWSSFEEIQATPNNIEVEGVPGVGSIPVGPMNIPHNWQDTFSVRLGGDYKLDQDFTLRAGYNFETGAPPDTYYNVFTPDSDKHTLAAGFSWAMDRWEFDLSTAYYIFADRQISDSEVRQINPTDAENELATIVGNGDYSSRYFVMGMAINYTFE